MRTDLRHSPRCAIVQSNNRWTKEEEFRRCRQATEALFERVASPDLGDRRENIGICALRLALKVRRLKRASTVIRLRAVNGALVRDSIAAPQSSIQVLRRLRRAVERDDRLSFLNAKLELPKRVARRVLELSSKDHAGSRLISDPWLLLFVVGIPPTGELCDLLPLKSEILEILDRAIADASKPGRRSDPLKGDLLTDVIRSWAAMTKSDLRQPHHLAGASDRSGGLAQFLRDFAAIWRVTLVSTNSGESMRRALGAASSREPS